MVPFSGKDKNTDPGLFAVFPLKVVVKNMVKEKAGWEDVKVKNFIWENLCKSDSARVNFAPILLDRDREVPSGQKFANAIDRMKDQGYVTDSRPDLQHYWIELTESGEKKCEEKDY